MLSVSEVMELSIARIWQEHARRGFALVAFTEGTAVESPRLRRLRQSIKDSGHRYVLLAAVIERPELIPAAAPPSHGQLPCLLIPVMEGEHHDEFIALAESWARDAGASGLFVHEAQGGETRPCARLLGGLGADVDLAPDHAGPEAIRKYLAAIVGTSPNGPWAVGLKYAERPQGWIAGMGREALGEVEIFRGESMSEWWSALGASRDTGEGEP